MFISGSEWSLKSCLLPLGWRGWPLETMLGSVQGGWAWLYPTDRKERRDIQKGLKQPRRDTSRSRAKTKRHTFYRHYNSYQSPDLSESGTFALRLVQLVNPRHPMFRGQRDLVYQLFQFLSREIRNRGLSVLSEADPWVPMGSNSISLKLDAELCL